jgi:hypothetical protein
MTSTVDVTNQALQAIGSRTTVTQAELTNQTSNEAKQANLVLTDTRDRLLRMAPWNCAMNFGYLTYITSLQGTPENSSAATQWAKGLPPPPWLYEYQYPIDCLRACWIIPQIETGAPGVPIYPAGTVTGITAFYNGPPIQFKVGIDQFFPVTGATIAAGGLGYVIGEVITLAAGSVSAAPIGAPAQLQVTTIGVGGAVTGVSVVNQILGSATPMGGSYFLQQANPVAQGSTTGAGVGATFNLTYGSKGDQRVVLTNQRSAILAYIKQVTDPNVMDPSFIEAWVNLIAGHLAIPLTGDKALANLRIQLANDSIKEARDNSGNEALVMNDFVPDWIRTRGYYSEDMLGIPTAFEWGGLWPTF